jgi:hypothetical protein
MQWIKWTLSAIVCVVSLSALPYADVWDTASDSDDSSTTDNELIHGTSQIHDLAARPGPVADQDWYRVGQKRQSSFEVVLDSTTGDLGYSPDMLQLVNAGGTLIQDSVPASQLGYSRSLRFVNTATTPLFTQYVRVGSAACGTDCTTGDQYHIRSMDTTISVARFNNSGSQITVLMSQNSSDVIVNAFFFYWSAGGTLLQTGSLSLSPKALSVFNTTTFASLVGVGGSITIAHDGPYGGLNVKSVALEPSTGFSFDTQGVYRGF